MALTLRRADAADADAIANVFSASLRLLTFLPGLHSVEEDRRFIADVILKECEVTVAVVGNTIVAFLAVDKEEIRFLHTHPDFIGKGAGSLLLEVAKDAADGVLELWCFQANKQARRFYAARGFRPIRFTDGEGNEERMPDVRYRWQRRAVP